MLIKPVQWMVLKNQPWVESDSKIRSDKQTDMVWQSTEDGQKEIALTMEIKRIDLLYRSISKRLTAIEQDYRMTKSL